ncbi:hypothetical protein BJ944DRAFT_245328 [Cunninghamella echinulata]|nr:hypothetical protein BJ944DRAFT_245328 [Cunninghamella echinulata]
MSLFQHISKFSILLLISLITVFAQDFVQITSPTSNQVFGSKVDVPIHYNIIGAQTLEPPPANATYPSSIKLTFQWLSKGTTDNPLNFTAVNSLAAKPFVAGFQNKQYTGSWKTPNCHFFSRYNPNNYDFSLVFTPIYNANALPDQQQDPISIPIGIQVNNATFPKC